MRKDIVLWGIGGLFAIGAAIALKNAKIERLENELENLKRERKRNTF